MRKHCGVPAFKFQLYPRREHRSDLGYRASLIRFDPCFRCREIHSVGVSLQQCHTTTRQLAAHELQRLSATSSDLIGRMDVREPCQPTGSQVPVRRIHYELHGGRQCLVSVTFRRLRRASPRIRLCSEPQLDQTVHEGQQSSKMITGWPDSVGPHQRRIQTRDVRFHDPVSDSRGEQV